MCGSRSSPVPVTPRTELRLIELFSSIQGEGLFLGRRQLFVRLADCNLECAYCDTPFQAVPVWRSETAPGSGAFREIANPVTPRRLTEEIEVFVRASPFHHSLALTGGEPLLQTEALVQWLPQMTEILPVFLETNGTLPQQLETLLPWLRWISMDIKLQSSCGPPTPWQLHARFMEVAGAALCQVKLVVAQQTLPDEIARAATLMAEYSTGTPLILQPRTVAGRPSVSGEHLLMLQDAAARIHRDTLVIPQIHPLLAVP